MASGGSAVNRRRVPPAGAEHINDEYNWRGHYNEYNCYNEYNHYIHYNGCGCGVAVVKINTTAMAVTTGTTATTVTTFITATTNTTGAALRPVYFL